MWAVKIEKYILFEEYFCRLLQLTVKSEKVFDFPHVNHIFNAKTNLNETNSFSGSFYYSYP
jgi:hypothetical protein